MEDLFGREQRILDNAAKRLDEIKNGAYCTFNEYEMLTKEYGRLLKQLRRVTKIFDKTTDDLNTSKLDLLDKVHFDALTGVRSRRFMEENLNHTIKSLSRSGSMLSVLMADVDYFKNYNDTYGHVMGDKCLKAIADAVNGSLLRTGDFAARYGGEEFIVVLPDTNEKGACEIANRLLKKVRDCKIPHENSDTADHVTVSIGVTTGLAKHCQIGAEYISTADKALYISKQNGRNRYTFLDFKEDA